MHICFLKNYSFLNRAFLFCFLLQPLPNQSQSRYSELDNRDWHGRSAQFQSSGEERSWESLRENKEFGNRFDSRQQEENHFNRLEHGRTQGLANQVVIYTFNDI